MCATPPPNCRRHVDRSCHLITAQKLDEMCAQIATKPGMINDVTKGVFQDVLAHPARDTVESKWASSEVDYLTGEI